jgi:glycosyltransferase involved in cell wall biosynthesis
VYGPLSQVSGGYLYDRQVLAELERLGHHVDVVHLPRRTYPRALVDSLRTRTATYFSKVNVDIMVEDELCHPSLVRRGWQDRAERRPRVALVHHLRHLESHPKPLRHFYRVVERRYLGSVDGVICTSRASLRAVRQTVGAPPPAVVAYPGRDHLAPDISADEIEARVNRGGPLRVLFVGSLTNRKRPRLLIEALSRLPKGSWLLEMVGRTDVESGTARALRRRIAAESDLARAVHLRGEAGEQEILEQYRRADVFCVPSQLEGFGIVYLEAMGFGLPALAAANGGASELVEAGICGYLIDGNNPIELAQHLEGYWRDRNHLLAHSLAARARWEQHPRWLDSATKIDAFLSRLVKGG